MSIKKPILLMVVDDIELLEIPACKAWAARYPYAQFEHDKDLQASHMLLGAGRTGIIVDQATHAVNSSPVSPTLFDILDHAQRQFLVITEHERYPQVTYFFNGCRDIVFAHETRIVLPSVPQHESSVVEMTQIVLRSLSKSPRDLYLIQYPSGGKQLLASLDTQLKQLYDTVVETMQGTIYLVATKNAQPATCLVLQKSLEHATLPASFTSLSDIAPLILQQMHLPVPAEMRPA